MLRSRTATFSRRAPLKASLALFALALLTSGFTSCAGTTGPLFAPLVITPTEVLLRASRTSGQEAIGLARVDGGDAGDRYEATIAYGKGPGVEWLTVEVSGRNLTLRARPDGLEPGLYLADVKIEEPMSGAVGSLHVEFTVLR
jgi:hypothetical protein